MQYGSFLGDGAERGPDYTAKALHVLAIGIVQLTVLRGFHLTF